MIRRPPWTDRDLDEPIRLPYPAAWMQKRSGMWGAGGGGGGSVAAFLSGFCF